MTKKTKVFILVLYIIFVTSLFSSIDKVIVKVNNENILQSDFDKLFKSALEQYKLFSKKELSEEDIKNLKQKVLEQLINDKLLLQEAKKQNIKVTKREIEDGIKTVKLRFPSDSAFQQELKKENLTEKQFEKRIEEQIMVLKLIDEKIRQNIKQPTEDEAKELFNQILKNIESKKISKKTTNLEVQDDLVLLTQLVERFFDEQVRVRHILIRVTENATQQQKEEAKKKIMEIKSKIDKGEDFATLAQKYSEDPSSKDRGGDIGFIARGDTVEEFEKVAFSLKEGQTSEIVETVYGFHIIKVIEKRNKRKPDFDTIKEDLLQYLARKNAEKYYEEYIENLKKSAKIEYLEKIK
ncbi:MAG: peptidylprolyl isomerase [Endomicrobiia bacterium]